MTPTSMRTLGAVAAVALVVGFLGTRFWDTWTGAPPGVPWTAPFLLGVLAVGFALAGYSLRPRLQRRPGHQPLDPFRAARVAVLALAGSRAGAAFAGLYLGYALYLVGDLTTEYRRRMLLVAAVAVLAGLATAAAALWLERECRVPPPGSEDDDAGAAPA